jgi:hypothetical protein
VNLRWVGESCGGARAETGREDSRISIRDWNAFSQGHRETRCSFVRDDRGRGLVAWPCPNRDGPMVRGTHRRNNIRSSRPLSIPCPLSGMMLKAWKKNHPAEWSMSSDPSWSSSSSYTPSEAHSADLLGGNRDGLHEYGVEDVENSSQRLSAGPTVDGSCILRLISSCKSRVLAVVWWARDGGR